MEKISVHHIARIRSQIRSQVFLKSLNIISKVFHIIFVIIIVIANGVSLPFPNIFYYYFLKSNAINTLKNNIFCIFEAIFVGYITSVVLLD